MSLHENHQLCEAGTKKNSSHPQWITSCLLNKLEVFGSAGIPINLHPSPLCPSLHYPRAPKPPFSVFLFFLFFKMRVKNNNTSLIPNSSRRFSPDPPHFALRPLSPLNASLFSASHQIPPSSSFPCCSDQFPLFLLIFTRFKVVKNKTNLEESRLILFISPLNVSSDFDSVTLSFLCLSPPCLGHLWTGGSLSVFNSNSQAVCPLILVYFSSGGEG